MKKKFTLRVDLESNKGIRKGLPRLLDLLKKYNLKASFYLVMGGESSLKEIINHRGKLKSAGERSLKIWSTKEKIRMVLFPKDFVKDNINILRRILEEGHELGLHGWKHRAWTRGLDRINIREHVIKAKKKYLKIFDKLPISFCSPGFNSNPKVIKILEEEGIRFISDFSGDTPQYYGKIKNVPITICGKNRTPIIEYMVSLRKSDKDILNYLKKNMKNNKVSSFYIHGLFEARFKLNLLEEIFKFIKTEKIQPMRIIDY
jgi:peptidoglycan/xylan/chitin deacetylase (PgdA/CDA1 family)